MASKVRKSHIDCVKGKPNRCNTIIEIIKDSDVRILDSDYYTKCRRCDTDIPLGIKEFCSLRCEYGLPKS